MRLLWIICATALATALLGSAEAGAVTLQQVGGKFEQPIYVTSDPGNANRLFVVERKGKIEEVNGATTTLFADLSSKVECGSVCPGERGLLSIALSPDFDLSGRLYVDYANGVDGTIHVAELRAGSGGAPLSSYRELLTIPHPNQSNHNGGQLQFGPEGTLFISTGDGGGENDVEQNAQDIAKPLGKILRIDPNPSGVLPYTIPAGNPFPAAPGSFESLVWAYGLRNPFRFSFDRQTGDLVIGDVGQEKWEEIDFAEAPGLGAGANYGWNCREGFVAGPATDPQCGAPTSPFVNPVFAYPHENPGAGGAFGCAIIGGYVVRDRSLGELFGRYIYADHCTGELRSLNLASPAATDRGEGLQLGLPDSFGEDSCGRLYVVSEADKSVSRLVSGAVPVPASGSQSSASSSCGGTTTPPLKPSFAGIKALRRRVQRGDKALITAWVTPCAGRKGEPIKLYRGRRPIATRHLDRACTARFRERISRRVKFRTAIRADETYEAATSRKLKIKPQRHPRKKHRRPQRPVD